MIEDQRGGARSEGQTRGDVPVGVGSFGVSSSALSEYMRANGFRNKLASANTPTSDRNKHRRTRTEEYQRDCHAEIVRLALLLAFFRHLNEHVPSPRQHRLRAL